MLICQVISTIEGWNSLNGIYSQHSDDGFFFQDDGNYRIVLLKDGCWAISPKSKFYFLARTQKVCQLPHQSSWTVLTDTNQYIPTNFLSVVQSTAALSAPTPPATTSTSAQSSHTQISKVGESASDWVRTDREGKTWFYNTKTQELSSQVPTVLCNIYSYNFNPSSEHSSGRPVEVYAPIVNGETGGGIRTGYVDQWVDAEEYWSISLNNLEGELCRVQSEFDQEIKQKTVRDDELQHYEQSKEKKSAKILDCENKERVAQDRSKNMTSRFGRSHVRRGDKRENLDPGQKFPTGEEIHARYAALFGDEFEPMAMQAQFCVEDLKMAADGTQIVVHDIIIPLFRKTSAWVKERIKSSWNTLAMEFELPAYEGEGEGDEADEEDEEESQGSIPRLFFLTFQQEPLLKAAITVDESEVNAIIKSIGAKAVALRNQLPTWVKNNNTTLLFDLGFLVRELLWLHMAIELSDPKCYLYPDIKAFAFTGDKSSYTEIFKRGKKHHIKEGSIVQVVVPGLYFELPATSAAPRLDEQGHELPSQERATPVTPIVTAKVQVVSEDNVSMISQMMDEDI